MVPKVAGKGRSFKGAGLYYLHDKQALTSERVLFTHTVNLPTADAEKAMGWMAHTAMRQAEIKAAAGGVAKGRKLTSPVYAYSLSWSPDEEPTQEQMLAAGMETLKRLGLEGHEAVFIAHKDEPHPHLHVIVNRVNPETGIAAPLSNDHLKLSEWAEEYERAHGKILCQQRVENNRRRKEQQFVKDRTSQSAAEFHRWRRARMEADFQRRQQEQRDLARRHGVDRDILGDVLKKLIAERRAEQKAQQKPLWADLYRQQRAEKRAFEQAQKTTFGRLRYWLKNRHLDRWGGESADRQGMLARAFNVVVNREIMAKALADKHEAERKALSDKVRADTAERLKSLYRAHDKMRDQMKQEQAAARAALQQKHSRESAEAARRIARGGDRATFDFQKANPPGEQPESSEVIREDEKKKRQAPHRTDGPGRPAQDDPSPAGTFNDKAGGTAALDAAEKDTGREEDKTGESGSGPVSRAFDDAKQRTEPPAPSGQDNEPEAGGKAFSAFRDAQNRKEPVPSPDQEPEGGKAFRAFRDARDGKDKDGGRDDGGRGRERKPPKSPGDQ